MVTWTFDLLALFIGFAIGILSGGLVTLYAWMRDGGAWSKGFFDGCAVDGALGLLKEQETRVMTLEEVKKHNNKDSCIWFELRNIVIIPVFVSQDRQETIIENPWIVSDPTIPDLHWKNIDYYQKWRCWTSRPTDERRKAVKWE